MRNAERWLRAHDRKLGSKTARPEQGYFALANGAIADILVAIGKIDADLLGTADMDRRTMHVREARGDLNRANGIRGLERPHRHDKRRFVRPCRLGRQLRDVDAGDAVLFKKR